jgi:hypothetical protein
MQKPIGRALQAWCPGGRTAQNAARASRFMTRSVASMAPAAVPISVMPEVVRASKPRLRRGGRLEPQGVLQSSIVGRYFFLPTDFLVLVWRGMKFAFRNWWRVAIVASVAIVGHYAFGAGVEGIAFLGFLAVLFAWDVDGRVSIGAGLSCLVLIVVMQALIQSGVLLLFETSTETVAVWAYYFLVIGVAKQLVDLVREGRAVHRKENPPA